MGIITATKWQEATSNPSTGTHVANYLRSAKMTLESHSVVMWNIGIF